MRNLSQTMIAKVLLIAGISTSMIVTGLLPTPVVNNDVSDLSQSTLSKNIIASSNMFPTNVGLKFGVQEAKADRIIRRYRKDCAESTTYRAHWGYYTRLNSCAITDLVEQHSQANTVLGLASIGAAAGVGFYFAGPLGAGFTGGTVAVANQIISSNKDGLGICKDRTGQAYIRYYLGRGNLTGAYVSCD